MFNGQHKDVAPAASAFVAVCFSLRTQMCFGFRLPEDLPLFLQHNQMQQCDSRVSTDDGPQRQKTVSSHHGDGFTNSECEMMHDIVAI